MSEFEIEDADKTNSTADLALINANVITVEEDQPRAEAVAISGDRIIAVGTNEKINALIDSATEVIDLTGKTVIPGLIEGHGHYIRLGTALQELDFRESESFDEILTLVEEAVHETPDGEWIIGRAWHQDKWTKSLHPNVEGLPLHNDLSAISPNNPVMLIHASNHGIFVNKFAMDLVGLDHTTVPPDGGEIVHDEHGNPIGMMRETAQDIFRKAYAEHEAQKSPEMIEREMRRKIQLAGEEAIRNGITSFQDLGSDLTDIDILKIVADEGKLPIRLYMSLQEEAAYLEDKLDDYKMIGHGNNFLTVRAIGEKVIDGALGIHGAWLLEPYEDMPESTGLNVIPLWEIEASAKLAMKHGYQLNIQGIGDRAVRELLNIYEAEMKRHPEKSDLRWRIEHAQVIHPDDIQRFVDLKVIPSVQGLFACSDGPWVCERLGEKRTLERAYIFNTLYEAGLTPMHGTDPPVENINPIASFHCSVTRELPDGSKFNEHEAYSREVALYAYTMGNAFGAFEENIKGSIKVGKLADITVLSQDLLTVPDNKIMDTKILMTILGGKVVYTNE